MEHIAETPGFPDGSWPREMTRDENRADLQRHADDFRNRKRFTCTVLDPGGRDVIGCVYIYRSPTATTPPPSSHGCGRATRTRHRSGTPSLSGSNQTGHSPPSSTRGELGRPQAAVQLDGSGVIPEHWPKRPPRRIGEIAGRQVRRKQRIDDSIGAGAVPTVVGSENALPRKACPLCNALRRDVLWVA